MSFVECARPECRTFVDTRQIRCCFCQLPVEFSKFYANEFDPYLAALKFFLKKNENKARKQLFINPNSTDDSFVESCKMLVWDSPDSNDDSVVILN